MGKISRLVVFPPFVIVMAIVSCSDDEPSGAASSSSSSGASSSSSSSSSSGGGGDGSVDPNNPEGGPQAGEGIAARHPGDVGIETDPDVIFADNFETYNQTSDLTTKWDNYFQTAQTKIVTDAANVRLGQKALEFNLPQQGTELSNGVQKILKTELDVLYLRYYSKFDGSFDVNGSSHNGGGINAHYFNGNNATPGVPANGTNKFLVEFECWRAEQTDKTPGVLNLYIYHPEQRSNYGDHFYTNGNVTPYSPTQGNKGNFGPDFVSRPEIVPELGRWYAYEVMLKANTPNQRDGRVTLWLDGKVIGDFTNLRLRDVDTLKIDRFNLSLHAGSNPRAATKKWYDAVVAAKSYIGPIR